MKREEAQRKLKRSSSDQEEDEVFANKKKEV